eukprot:scaffold226701_cov31-Tisochrysis_lutea.AAC.3
MEPYRQIALITTIHCRIRGPVGAQEQGTPKPACRSPRPDEDMEATVVSQTAVVDFYSRACAAIASADPRVPCVVGPTPYYKVVCHARPLASPRRLGRYGYQSSTVLLGKKRRPWACLNV